MEPIRADRKPAGRFQACRLIASVAVVAATVILAVGVCVFLFAMPSVDPTPEPPRWQRCEKLLCELDPMLPMTSQDPRCSRCPAGWLWRKERCYFFSSVRLWENLNWNESAEFCWRHNSSLVVLEDPAEMDFLQCVMKKYPNFTFPWVGLTDTQQEGHWVWMDGSDLQRNMPLMVEWDSNDADCADLRGEKSLFAVSCDSYGPWVCKKKL
ncbi:CD209 antigen-like protein C isoform X2 [Takifugu flavidus]|nr:CD209 antigen-like protein C isoform X2 [Takifugu flavidus]